MAGSEDEARALRPRIDPWREVYANERFTVFRTEAHFEGATKTYYPCEHGSRAGIVVPWQGGVVLVRQWRLLIEGFSLELPGGKVDKGETPAEAAARECLEETGLRCERVEPLLHYLPGLDLLNNPTDVFLARDVIDTGSFRESGLEVVSHLSLPLEECLARVARGEILCGLTIMGLLAYARWRDGRP